MKQITKLFTLLALTSMVLLAACGPTPPETEETEETEHNADTAEGGEITLYVGPELKECTGEGPQTCMMVKENPEDEYTFFYDQIDGFEYEEGYEYELRVLVTPVENPPAGGSSLNYSLVEVVNKTAVESTETESASLDGTAWQVDSYAVDGEMVETLPGTTFAFADGMMVGMTGCNNSSAGYTTDGNNISFEMGMSTMMFCGDAENGQEDAIQANIAAVTTYEISGDSMQMMDADGNIILQFSAIDMDTAMGGEDTMDEVNTTLEGTLWQLDSYTVDGEMVDTLPGTTFAFTDGQMAAMTGCNNTGAEYTTDGNNISFGLGMSTMMFCGDAENGQEDAVRANLDTVATYEISGDTMNMMDADGNVILQFSVMESASLTDTLWQATQINNGVGGAISLLAETTITAVFGTDGTLSGNASCNIYNTTYEANDGNMNINPSIITTRRACAEPIAEQEGQYLTALANATTYTIVGDKLELRDANGSLQASYIAVPPTPLVGTTWEATGINNGSGGVVSLVGGSRVTAVFNEDNALNGNSGCNTYFGSYELMGDNGLTISNELGSTMMACGNSDVMAQEAAYLAALGTVATYNISNDKLELRTADGALAVSYVATQPIPLANSKWDVTFHNNGRGGVTSSIIGTQMTMNFDAEGGVNGSAGCNNYFGSYEAGSELLTFGPMASTEMFCTEPEGIMEQEAEFLAALATVSTYNIDGARMNMRDESGATAVNLQVKGYIEPEVLDILENATYSSEFTADETLTLVDGQHQQEAAPGSASMETVIFVDAAVGVIDDNYSAAVVLATNNGGTGTFISLHLMQFDNGEAVEIAATQLGDRTQINSVEINVNGEIVIDMVRHSDDDPLCCPTEAVIITYALEGNELVETSVVEMEG